MSNQDINKLLDKYWSGESSLADEQSLRDYFSHSSIAPEHEEFKSLFNAFNSAQDLKATRRLDRDALRSLAADIPQAGGANVISFNWMQPLRVAAAIAFLLIAGWTVMNQFSEPQVDLQASTMETPEEALEQSRAALLYVASVLNKGVQASEELNHLKSINDVIPGS